MLGRLLVVIVILTGVGCNSDHDDSSADQLALTGQTWVLNAYSRDENKQDILDQTYYSIRFDGEIASGDFDCNTFSSNYLQEGDALVFQIFSPTEIACLFSGEEDYQEQDRVLFQAFASVQNYQINQERLLLSASSGVELEFTPEEMP